MRAHIVVLLVAATAFAVFAPAGRFAVALEQQTLQIKSKTGTHTFQVELAVTDEERARGLMFRRVLAEDHGMLFDFKGEHDVSMWMENTYISLDMIFIRSDGTIRHIADNTEPMSRRIIPSGGPVQAVLEIPAGVAKKLGIVPGDKVTSPILRR